MEQHFEVDYETASIAELLSMLISSMVTISTTYEDGWIYNPFFESNVVHGVPCLQSAITLCQQPRISSLSPTQVPFTEGIISAVLQQEESTGKVKEPRCYTQSSPRELRL